MTTTTQIAIRRARAVDEATIWRLSQLDSRKAPRGEVLLAETCGEAVAAISLADRHVVADPFRRTAEVVDLLRLRADQLAGELRLGRELAAGRVDVAPAR